MGRFGAPGALFDLSGREEKLPWRPAPWSSFGALFGKFELIVVKVVNFIQIFNIFAKKILSPANFSFNFQNVLKRSKTAKN